MAIKAQCGPLRWYSDIRSRQWETASDMENKKTDIVFYPTGRIPEIQLIIDSVGEDEYPQIYLDLMTENDEGVATGSAIMMAVTTRSETEHVLTYYGYDIPEDQYPTPQYLYARITCGEDIYVSDMFAWTDDPDSFEDENRTLLKVQVQTSDFLVGGYKTLMDGLTHTFYLSADEGEEDAKVDQRGNERKGITDTLSGTRVFHRTFDISANRAIWIFLSSLGIMKANGKVTVTWRYEAYDASDIVVTKETGHGQGMYELKLTFVDEAESVSVNNKL